MNPDERLRQAIRKCGISLDDIANRAGITRLTISRFMSGRPIQFSTTRKLAEYIYDQIQERQTPMPLVA